ncbi:galactofuranose ABC transporter, permease protein YjfF [Microbacterium sp. MPKO10]|uniref:galactofuranose ABC transporter, permease protein YjfF n=1 Tax=Microbacterium sp. MPKO10 TaxID=2989818 RepID=UPI002235DE4D|nr:galactofuranose ABC transporter, permease protein YjfF [Microbacterium sp. MPKO10]MCW4456659.1 sugar ABC transporter permease YjfF [Microbacterium sp. MPKO10]
MTLTRTQPESTPGTIARSARGLHSIRDVFTNPKYGPVIVTGLLLVGMFIYGMSQYRGFTNPQIVVNLLIDNAHLVVLAVGMTFVILTAGIDLSVGAVLALATMMTASMAQSGLPAGVIIPLILVSTTVLGLLVGVMVHYFDIQPFIATLAAMFLARGLCYVISAKSISIEAPFFTMMGQTRLRVFGLSITPSVIVAVLVVIIAVILLRYTRFGRTVYAIGGSEASSTLMGLPVARTKVLVYAISGFCSGLAGVLYTFYTLSGYALTAVGTELDAIAAVVIGGTLLTGGYGSVLGSVLGVLVLGTIQTLITFDGTLTSWWTKIFIGALLLIFIVLQKVLTLRRG